MIKKNTKLIATYLVVMFIYVFIGTKLEAREYSINSKWLFWNIFLAMLPMIFAYLMNTIHHLQKRWGLFSLGFAALWLLFLPNSCYMITDLIHLNSDGLIIQTGVYSTNMRGWIEVLYLGAGIFLAIISGLFSTSMIHEPMKSRKYKVLDFIWIIAISLLCGYGVYIGRFLRLNSWDILHVRTLINILLDNIDRFAILFSFMIASFFFVTYLLFDLVIKASNTKSNI